MIQLLDVVALLEDLPDEELTRGQVGTVVDIPASNNFVVEFSDAQGHTYAILELSAEQLMVLHFEAV